MRKSWLDGMDNAEKLGGGREIAGGMEEEKKKEEEQLDNFPFHLIPPPRVHSLSFGGGKT